MMSKRPTYRISGEKYHTKSELHSHVRQMLMLERLLSRFHLVARQLQSRYGNREAFHIDDEFDVRDLLQALLRLDYDDIRLEEWTPNYGDGISRTDFILKLEKIVVMAKMTLPGFGTKELEEQLMVDIQKYQQHPDCRTLVCFVYDPDGLIANPHIVENDLSGDKGGCTIRVMIAPKSK